MFSVVIFMDCAEAHNQPSVTYIWINDIVHAQIYFLFHFSLQPGCEILILFKIIILNFLVEWITILHSFRALAVFLSFVYYEAHILLFIVYKI